MRREIETSLNLGSTADIAFLLLIFFLVATTIDMDSGLLRKLPEIDDTAKSPIVNKRNVLIVLINSNDELMVQGETMNILKLKDKVIEFLTNPANAKNLPDKEIKDIPLIGKLNVSKGIISLQNDRNTTYATYISVMNELITAGNYLKNEFSMEQFNKSYDQLSTLEKKAVRKAVPVMISEAEPININK